MSAVHDLLGEGASTSCRATRHVRDQLLALAGGEGELLVHAERAWASITFAGTRHTLQLRFEGLEAVAAGEALIEALPEHEFTIPGQLVADAAIADVERRLLPFERLTVTVELLLLEDER